LQVRNLFLQLFDLGLTRLVLCFQFSLGLLDFRGLNNRQLRIDDRDLCLGERADSKRQQQNAGTNHV
jgi:hypothetical protein